MLELQSVAFRNFLSYGDYETKIDLADLGQCFVSGEIVSDQEGGRMSNGAGKSSIPSAIQWCLFGRTMHSHAPGNKVINWFTGKDCVVRINFKNGDSITRTRNTDGHDELIYIRGGEENKLSASTLSTSKAMQTKLSKDFMLDWDLFIGSSFSTQYNKPWLELSDQVRKKAIERVVGIDRFVIYSNIAKSKMDAADNDLRVIGSDIEKTKRKIESKKLDYQKYSQRAADFETNRVVRQKEMMDKARSVQETIDKLVLPDIDDITAKWNIVQRIEAGISKLKSKKNDLYLSIQRLNASISDKESFIKRWKDSYGKTCVKCEQPIASAHIDNKIDPVVAELAVLKAELDSASKSHGEVDAAIKKYATQVANSTPKLTVAEAKTLHNRRKDLDNHYASIMQSAVAVMNEENPYNSSTVDYQVEIDALESDLKAFEQNQERSAYLFKHYNYIYKAYHDRNRIRKYVTEKYIPFFNKRLQHYLESFKLDVKIQLTDTLGLSSNMWGYDFESGGERKRTDVAFMLAMFDLHEYLHGRQCNILVLDEVDGRMDDDGVECLVNILRDDISNRVETVLVISHKPMMKDMFSKEIKVTRTDRFSTVEVS